MLSLTICMICLLTIATCVNFRGGGRSPSRFFPSFICIQDSGGFVAKRGFARFIVALRGAILFWSQPDLKSPWPIY